MDEKKKTSLHAIEHATRSVADFSGHGKALGAAGLRMSSDHPENSEFLGHPGQSISISPGKDGFEYVLIGLAWDNIAAKHQKKRILKKLSSKQRKIGVDLDLGCIFEMKDGTRGAIQAFGDKFGDFESPPFIALSGDERTGDKEGFDEYLLINGKKWDQIKRILVYIYIYDGVLRWSSVKPQVMIDVPGESDFYVTLGAYDDHLKLCAIAELENVRGGIKLTNRTEYFPGHEEMDRAFGMGLNWSDGKKPPL